MARKNHLSPLTITSDYFDRNILGRFIDTTSINFQGSRARYCDLLNVGSSKKAILKYVAHRLYRLFFRRKKGLESAIRSWVEITEMMYGAKYPSSLVLIYPFYLNLKRHYRYIRSCFKNYDNVSLCGLPYSITDLVGLVLCSSGRDKKYISFEVNAYREHARELVKLGIGHLYTSDEFEAASIVMCRELQANNVRVINTAHGLSFDCPYIGYDFFKVYNSAQLEYYSLKSGMVKYEVSPRRNAHVNEDIKDLNKQRPALIFIEANFERLGMLYESLLESSAIETIREAGESLAIDVYLKAHPNRKLDEYSKKEAQSGLKIIGSLAEVGNIFPIFITIASAAYYDFRHLGPFLFVEDGFSDLKDFYGENVHSYSIDDLPEAIKSYVTERRV